MMRKRTLILAAALLAAFVAVPAYAYGPSLNNPYASETGVPLTVHVDGRYVATDVDPYVSNGRTYLPLRAAAESMGAAVVWDNASRSATVSKDGTVIRCTVGSTVFTVNGTSRYNDAAPQIVSGRTMLPIRPIAEALGGTLAWDGYTASVTIDTPAADAPAPSLPSDVPYQVRWLVEKYYVPADSNGNGSWYYQDTTGRSIYSRTYLFISEMVSGTRQAVKVGYRAENGMVSDIGADSFTTTKSGNALQIKDGWPPFYWHGAGIGGGPTFNLEDYVYNGANLQQIGYQTYFNNGVSTPTKYGPYKYTNQTWLAM